MSDENHHPSCTPNDESLIWYCNQCGLMRSAEQDALRIVEVASKLANLLKDSYWAQCPLDVAKSADELLSALNAHHLHQKEGN